MNRKFIFFSIFVLIFFSTVMVLKSNKTKTRDIRLVSFNEEEVQKSTKNFYSVARKANNHPVAPEDGETQEAQTRQETVGTRTHLKTDESIDLLIQKILLDINLAREEKITLLWSFLEEQLTFDPENLHSIEHLTSALATLWPIELTDELIAMSSNDSLPSMARLQLLEVLVRATKMYTRVDPITHGPQGFPYVASKMEAIQAYFLHLLTSPQENEMLARILALAPAVLTSDQYHLIDLTIKAHGDHMPFQTMIQLRLDMALSNASTQEQLLPGLTDDINRGDYSEKEKRIFLEKLLSYAEGTLSMEAEMGDSLPETLAMPKSVKAELLKFLGENEPRLTPEQYSEDPLFSAIEYMEWFRPFSRLSTVSLSERASFISRFVETAPSPKHLVIIRDMSSDTNVMSHLLANSSLQERLIQEQSNVLLTPVEKEQLGEILERYNQHQGR